MNLFNIYIENEFDIFTISEISDTDLNRIIEAYDFGKESIFINGKKYNLKGLNEIRIFDMTKLKGTFNDFINIEENRQFNIFKENRIIGHKIPLLSRIGNDLTNQYIINDFGWKNLTKKNNFLNNVPDVPLLHLNNILNLLTELNNKHGFLSTDFAPPIPSHLDTSQVGWRLELKQFPEFYFYFRTVNDGLEIKHYPSKNESIERNVKLTYNTGKSFPLVVNQATSWLKVIYDLKQEHKRWTDIFSKTNNDFSPFEIINEENELEIGLSNDEIQNVRIFLNAFDDLIQASKILPSETKTAYSATKKEIEKELENKPTKKFYKWMSKLFENLSVKYLTDSNYRDEVNNYINIAFEKVKHLGLLAYDLIKQIKP